MRRAAALLLAGLLLLLTAAPAGAQQEPAFPRLTGRVVDEAGVLEAAAEARLAAELEAHERATGDQVVVATVRSLQGYAVEEYANRLFRAWALGGAERDDGALLVVAPQERKVRIEVGYGLEGDLTDAAAATIVQSLILPRFRAGDLQGGVEAGARGLLELLRPEGAAGAAQAPGWTAPRRAEQASAAVPVVPVLFAFVFLILLMRLLGGRRRGGGGGGYGRGPLRRGFGYGYPPVIVFPGGSRGGGGGFGGGGLGGGGGFSGGGGSSGGGGASGSW